VHENRAAQDAVELRREEEFNVRQGARASPLRQFWVSADRFFPRPSIGSTP
jgi:hypothetical protein